MIEDEYEISLGFCLSMIKNWKQWRCRSNSKKAVEICTRTNYGADQECFWKFWLELYIAGKMVEQHRIRREAFDSLTRNPDLPRVTYTHSAIEFCTIFTWAPTLTASQPHSLSPSQSNPLTV